MVVIQKCKNFDIISFENKIIIKTPLQTFYLRGILQKTKQLTLIESNLHKIDSLNTLMGLFYSENDECKKQEVELVAMNNFDMERLNG